MLRPLGRHPRRAISTFVIGALAVSSAVILGPGRGFAASTSPASQALAIANYAEGTASHERPAHLVTAADVTNAISALRSSATSIQATFNVGDLPGYESLAGFIDQTTYTQVCIEFPPRILGTPHVIDCPPAAIVLWQTLFAAIGASQHAVVAASRQNRAVSGADVMSGAAAYHLKLAHRLTFKSGLGGTAEFVDIAYLKNKKYTVHLCVRLPKTAYGIPVATAC